MAPRFRQLTIIGLGLIGGSVGLAARRRGLAERVVGVGLPSQDRAEAVRLGAVDEQHADAAKAATGADLVVVATPVGQMESVARAIGPALAAGVAVTDVGSVKGRLVARMEALLGPAGRFVGGHPIAGRERSGVAAAEADLFEGSICVLTPTAATDPSALETVRSLWSALGASVVVLDPEAHDRILAAVSHLPHIVAYAMVRAATEMERNDPGLLSYSAGGFRDFTRIAASSPEMWRDICLANGEHLIAAIERFEAVLARLKGQIVSGDGAALAREFEAARSARQNLPTKRPH